MLRSRGKETLLVCREAQALHFNTASQLLLIFLLFLATPAEQQSSPFHRLSSSLFPGCGYPEPGHDHEYEDDTIVPPVYVPAGHPPFQDDEPEALLSSDRVRQLYYLTLPGRQHGDAVAVMVLGAVVRVVVHAAAVPGCRDADRRYWEAVEGNLLEIRSGGIED